MTISLRKGGNISLVKQAGGSELSQIMVGLGWDARKSWWGRAYDLDAMAFLCGADDQVRSEDDFIFYGHLRNADGSVEHMGDNLTGEGEGDDEQIRVHLDKLPAEIEKVAIAVVIYQGKQRRQYLGMVENAFVRIVDERSGRELARFDISESMGEETGLLFAEIYRRGRDWKLKAIGEGFDEGLTPIAQRYGLRR